jgi:hypothetical protein
MPKVDQSGYQLDKKELLKDVPLALKMPVGAFVDWANGLDANHDGKADIAQLAPIVIKMLPIGQALLPLIHNDLFIEWFINHDFIKDKVAAKAVIEKLLNLAVEAGKVAAK